MSVLEEDVKGLQGRIDSIQKDELERTEIEEKKKLTLFKRGIFPTARVDA